MSTASSKIDKATWAQWDALSPRKRELAIEYVEASRRKADCCMPYDCMHHETCGLDDLGYCGTCRHLQDLDRAIGGVSWVIWHCAGAIVDDGERAINAERLEHARALESEGDYAGAARLLGEEEWS